MDSVLRKLWRIALVSAVAAASWRPITEVDLFFHLSLGRAVLAAGARVVPEPTAFSAFYEMRVVPQWLWDVVAYLIYQSAGPVALGILTMLLAASCALALLWLLRVLQPSGALAAEIAVSGLAMAAVASRMDVRPSACFLLLLPLSMGLAWKHSEASGRIRRFTGCFYVLLTLLWAQIHGSFVLAPAIWLLVVAPSYLPERMGGRGGVGRALSVDIATLVACVLALFASALGASFVPYVLSHASSDAALHLAEMRPMTLGQLASGPLPLLLWILGSFGVFRAGTLRWSEVALALLGLLLGLSAQRFYVAASLLAAPLAYTGANTLCGWARASWPRKHQWLSAAALVPVLITANSVAELSLRERGPYGTLGLTEGEHPVLAAAYLTQSARLPLGSNPTSEDASARGRSEPLDVMTSYQSGSALAFFGGGLLRSYVDGRTPLHFDSTDYAVERDLFNHEAALERALERYALRTAVVRRERSECGLFAERWIPVVIEARHTTFVRAGDDVALASLLPCGEEVVAPDVCRNGEEGTALLRSIERLDAIGPSELARYLRAEHALRCRSDPDAALETLPSATKAWSFQGPYRRAEIAALFASGDTVRAADLLLETLRRGDVTALATLEYAGADALSAARYREFLEIAIQTLDDRSGAGLRARLARLCVADGDAECARFHGLRAFVRGEPRATGVLRWLARQADSERVRADARAWLDAESAP